MEQYSSLSNLSRSIRSGKIYRSASDNIIREFLSEYQKTSSMEERDYIAFKKFLENNIAKYGKDYFGSLVKNFDKIESGISPKDNIGFEKSWAYDDQSITIDFFNQDAYDYFDGNQNNSFYDSISILPDRVYYYNWGEKN